MFVFRKALFTNRNLAIHVLTCKDDLYARLEHSKIRIIVLVDVTRSATNIKGGAIWIGCCVSKNLC